ncbi:hypothetical protein AOLI_G00037180 [Acnodon oligacanthus]
MCATGAGNPSCLFSGLSAGVRLLSSVEEKVQTEDGGRALLGQPAHSPVPPCGRRLSRSFVRCTSAVARTISSDRSLVL